MGVMDEAVDVKLRAQTGDLKAGMREAADTVERETNQIRQSLNRLENLSFVTSFNQGLQLLQAGMRGLEATWDATVGAVVARGERLQDLSRRLSMSVENLSVQEFAASQAGVNIESIGLAYRKAAAALVEASQEGSGAQKLLTEGLGYTTSEIARLRTLDPVSLFFELGTRLDEFEDGAGKARAGTELFGRGFEEVLVLVREGREAFDQNVELAKRLGLAMGTDSAAGADRFGDATAALWKVWDGFLNQLLTGDGTLDQSSQSLEAMTGDLADMARELATTGREVLPLVVEGVRELSQLVREFNADPWKAWEQTLRRVADYFPVLKQMLAAKDAVSWWNNEVAKPFDRSVGAAPPAAPAPSAAPGMTGAPMWRPWAPADEPAPSTRGTRGPLPLPRDEAAAKDAEKAAKEAARLADQEYEHRMELFQQGLATERQVLSERLQANQEHQLAVVADEEQALEFRKNLGLVSGEDYLQQMRELLARRYEIQREALEQERQLAQDDPVALARIDREEQQLTDAEGKDMERLSMDEAGAQVEQIQQLMDGMFGSLAQGFDRMIQGMIQGTLRFGQSWRQLGMSMLLQFVSWIASMIARWAAFQVLRLALFVGAELGMTAFKLIQDQIRKQSTASEARTSILAKAYEAASAAMASASQIPYVGWILGPVAFGTVLALGLGAMAAVSAKGGAGDIPEDGTLGILHAREMVLPAPIAQTIRDLASGASGGSAGPIGLAVDRGPIDRAMAGDPFGSSAMADRLDALESIVAEPAVAPVINITAMDARGVRQFFEDQGPALWAAMQKQGRLKQGRGF